MENKLWRITLDTNPEDCNLHCIMCEEHSEFSDFKQHLLKKIGTKRRLMPFEWIKPILQESKELGVQEIIPTTMGEPLVSKHFEIIAKEAKKLNLKLNITHNGTFPRKKIKEWADIIIPITSDIKISWNGATNQTAEKIMKGINYQNTIDNLNEFVKYRNIYFEQTGFYCKISLQLTFLQSNMHELTDIIKLASNIGIDRIKGHHLWTHFNEIKHLSFENSPESKQKWNEIVKLAYDTAQNHLKPNGEMMTLENFFFFNTESSILTNEIPENYECPFLQKELWIAANGKISPCCAPDEQRNSLGNFGNYPEKNLSDVLISENYQTLIKNYKNFDLCKTCKMRKPIKK